MYIPPAFAVTNFAKLHDFIEAHSFGILISQIDSEPFATHLPFLLDRVRGSKGTLIGHMARANPQWQELMGQNGLVVFSGPHAYISPSWYEVENVVPTWNYVAVHVAGRAQVVEDPKELLEIVQKSVQFYEQSFSKPWTFDGSAKFIERLLMQIVGFRIEIEKIEGKWKLNQNHPIERRAKVVSRLESSGDQGSLEMAAMMRMMLAKGEQ